MTLTVSKTVSMLLLESIWSKIRIVRNLISLGL